MITHYGRLSWEGSISLPAVPVLKGSHLDLPRLRIPLVIIPPTVMLALVVVVQLGQSALLLLGAMLVSLILLGVVLQLDWLPVLRDVVVAVVAIIVPVVPVAGRVAFLLLCV